MGRSLHPFVLSEGHGPTVVLVHGGWTDHRTWDLVVPFLVADHRVVRPDRRGHSRSAWPHPVTRRQDEHDLESLIESLDAGPVHLVGNSYGASISLGLAARRAELLASVTVHEPPLLGVALPGTPLDAERSRIQAVAAVVVADVAAGRAEDAARRFVEEVALGPGAWSYLPPGTRATMIANASTFVGMLEDPAWDAAPPAPPTSLPVLLTDGSTSPTWLRMVVDELAAAALVHAERLTFDGAGHVPHATHPADLAAAIRDFVSAAPTSQSPLTLEDLS